MTCPMARTADLAVVVGVPTAASPDSIKLFGLVASLAALMPYGPDLGCAGRYASSHYRHRYSYDR
jgi:hypothetical protein